MKSEKKWTGERLESSVFNETTIEHLHRYAIALELAAGKNVLDLACGEGYGSYLLAGKATRVTGIDNNEEVVREARSLYKKPNLHFLSANADQLPCETAEFDLVVSFETIEHLSNHEGMITEIKRVLKPGGTLVISTPDKKNYSDNKEIQNPYHVKELYKQEFMALLSRHFTHTNYYGQRMLHCSLISSSFTNGLEMYTGNYQDIHHDPNNSFLYHIVIASDTEPVKLPNSLFNGNTVVEKALELREKMVTNTITYKLGHALLYPAKLARRFFKRPGSA